MWGWIIAVIEPIVAWLANRWPAFARLVNGVLIDGIVKQTRSRPHPWSTRTDYISWIGLTDRTYSARHLPATDFGPHPPLERATALFARPTGEQVLCPKSTMLFPAFAQYLTDGFIRTKVSNDDALTDRRRNTSNHEIDLCPLYGRTEAQTHALRLRSPNSAERGRLKSQRIQDEEYPPALYDQNGVVLDEFAVLDPPLGIDKVPAQLRPTLFAVGGDRANATVGVSMINTLLLREHNRLAGLIAANHTDWDDDRVFETARNVMIVLFIKLVVEEYINHISPSRIRLLADPSGCWDKPWNKPNWITAEFSLLYRWHSLVPDRLNWNGVETSTGNLRFANPLFTSVGLAQAFAWMSAQPAARLGMGNTADFLQDVEAHAIDQARVNQIAPYNAYRRTMGMAPVKTFADITTKTNIVERLEQTYPAGVESVEFYVGMFAEDVVDNSPLPSLILRMVAVDAFSQALTNPLLSAHIWGDDANRRAAFTDLGLEAIAATGSMRDLLVRNGADPGPAFVGMTRPDWARNAKVQRAA
ncbi:peroxidase family protein [Caulobacter sp. DWP3-1-3b2]|uniref:peroxidase family protein n=1 Tax=Caulobacter sp. DWP3-1-3b2 TaxID=2804643 RepID=UPI003CF44230